MAVLACREPRPTHDHQPIINDLSLKQFGYNIVSFGPYFQAYPDGRAVQVFADNAQKSHESILQFSKKDADVMGEWESWLAGVANILGPLLPKVPPRVGSTGPGDLLQMAEAAMRFASWACAVRQA